MFDTVLVLVFPAFMALAACSDLLTMKISNRLVLTAAAAFFPIALYIGLPLADLGIHMGVAAAMLALTFSLFAAGWIGGGDAKLAAAIVLWLGVELILPFVIYAGIFGGALTLALLMARRFMLPAPLLQVGWIWRLHDKNTGIPYGIALAIAAMVVYGDSAIFQGLMAQPETSTSLFDELQSF